MNLSPHKDGCIDTSGLYAQAAGREEAVGMGKRAEGGNANLLKGHAAFFQQKNIGGLQV